MSLKVFSVAHLHAVMQMLDVRSLWTLACCSRALLDAAQSLSLPLHPRSIAAFDIDNTLNEKLPKGAYAIHWASIRAISQLQRRGYAVAFVTGRSLDYVQQLVRAAPADVRWQLHGAFVSAENGAAFAKIDSKGRRLTHVRLDESLVVPQQLRTDMEREIGAQQRAGALGADLIVDKNGPRAVASVGTPSERNLSAEEKVLLQHVLDECCTRFRQQAGEAAGENEVPPAYPCAVDVRRRESDQFGVTLKERGTVRLLQEFFREHRRAPDSFLAVGDTVTQWGVAGSSDMQTALAARKCGLQRVGFGFVGPRSTLPLAQQWSERAGIALFVPPRMLDASRAESSIVGPAGVLDLIEHISAFEEQFGRVPAKDASLRFPDAFKPILLPATKSPQQLGLAMEPAGEWSAEEDEDN